MFLAKILLKELTQVCFTLIFLNLAQKILIVSHELFNFINISHYFVTELALLTFLTKSGTGEVLARKVLKIMREITFQTSMAVSCQKILAQIFLKEWRLIVLGSNLSLIRSTLKLRTSCLKTLALSLSIELVLILFLLKLTLVLRLKFLPLIKTVSALLIKLILLFRLSLSLLILVLELRLNVIVRSLHFYWCL